jgi:hypothetical protein
LERHIGRVGVGVGVRFLKIRVELTGAGATYRQSWSWSWSAIFENRSGVDRSWSGAYPELPISEREYKRKQKAIICIAQDTGQKQNRKKNAHLFSKDLHTT